MSSLVYNAKTLGVFIKINFDAAMFIDKNYGRRCGHSRLNR